MLDGRQLSRPPHPINGSEQTELMKHLPAHLQCMLLFALNCGARDDDVCGLQWAWERRVGAGSQCLRDPGLRDQGQARACADPERRGFEDGRGMPRRS